MDIVSAGTHVISDLKKGDLSLHSHYIASLKSINPKIASYWKVAEIINIEKQIEKLCYLQISAIPTNTQLSVSEISYCYDVFQNILKATDLKMLHNFLIS